MDTPPTAPASDDAVDLVRLRRSPPHPGLMLTEYLRGNGVSAAAAARRMAMSETRLSEIRQGKRAMTPEACVQVGALTSTRPEFWGRLQMRHDVWHAMQAYAASVKSIASIVSGPLLFAAAPIV